MPGRCSIRGDELINIPSRSWANTMSTRSGRAGRVRKNLPLQRAPTELGLTMGSTVGFGEAFFVLSEGVPRHPSDISLEVCQGWEELRDRSVFRSASRLLAS